jgi:hypothetical protein
MKIIKHLNPHFPNRETYKCTIGNTTRFGTLKEVTDFRDDRVQNEDYYEKLRILNDRGCSEYYSNTYPGRYTGD